MGTKITKYERIDISNVEEIDLSEAGVRYVINWEHSDPDYFRILDNGLMINYESRTGIFYYFTRLGKTVSKEEFREEIELRKSPLWQTIYKGGSDGA